MTPTELIEELKNIKLKQLKLKIKLFYDTLTHKTKYYTVSTIVRFYRIVGEVQIEMENSTKVKPKTQIQIDKTLVDKDIIRKLLEFADLRDSLILMSCFDSGMWGVDIVGLNFGDLSEYINLENPKDVNDVAVILVERSKTEYQQLAGFGKQTLYYIGKWLNYRIENGETITEKSPIYTMKDFPFQRLKNKSISPILVRLCENAGLDKRLTTSDFRNSFNTRIDDETRMPNATKEFFMGHQSIERSYKITKLPKYIEQYHEVWEKLFDLTTDYEQYESLQDENVELRRKLKELETEQTDLKLVVDKLSEAFSASVREQQEEAEMYLEWKKEKEEIEK
jgi:integrase